MSDPCRLLRSQCSYCEVISSDLLTCRHCKVVKYCCEEHRRRHLHKHMVQCNTVNDYRDAGDDVESLLRASHPTVLTRENFDNALRRTGVLLSDLDVSIIETYITTQTGLIKVLRSIPTHEALEAALHYTLKFLNLSSVDVGRLYDYMVPLMLRLGYDQDAFDALAWHDIKKERSASSRLTDTPFSWPKGNNAFVSLPQRKWWADDLLFPISMTLVKLRLLFCLKDMENALQLAAKEMPQEILDSIRLQLANSALTCNHSFMRVFHSGQSISPYEHTIYKQVHARNGYFWELLVSRRFNLTTDQSAWNAGKLQSAQRLVQTVYEAWAETPGAIEWIVGKLKDGTESTGDESEK